MLRAVEDKGPLGILVSSPTHAPTEVGSKLERRFSRKGLADKPVDKLADGRHKTDAKRTVRFLDDPVQSETDSDDARFIRRNSDPKRSNLKPPSSIKDRNSSTDMYTSQIQNIQAVCSNEEHDVPSTRSDPDISTKHAFVTSEKEETVLKDEIDSKSSKMKPGLDFKPEAPSEEEKERVKSLEKLPQQLKSENKKMFNTAGETDTSNVVIQSNVALSDNEVLEIPILNKESSVSGIQIEDLTVTDSPNESFKEPLRSIYSAKNLTELMTTENQENNPTPEIKKTEVEEFDDLKQITTVAANIKNDHFDLKPTTTVAANIKNDHFDKDKRKLHLLDGSSVIKSNQEFLTFNFDDDFSPTSHAEIPPQQGPSLKSLQKFFISAFSVICV